jgi:hypothetical protein
VCLSLSEAVLAARQSVVRADLRESLASVRTSTACGAGSTRLKKTLFEMVVPAYQTIRCHKRITCRKRPPNELSPSTCTDGAHFQSAQASNNDRPRRLSSGPSAARLRRRRRHYCVLGNHAVPSVPSCTKYTACKAHAPLSTYCTVFITQKTEILFTLFCTTQTASRPR